MGVAKIHSDKHRLLKQFGIRAVILFIIWSLAFNFYIVPTGTINNQLTRWVVQGTQYGLQMLGYSTWTEIKPNAEESSRLSMIIYMDSEPAVLVADGCNGLELFALFVGFIICFPGPSRPKFLFCIGGTAVLFLLNIIREIVLALNYHHFRISFDFNHKYTYAGVVYFVVFLIWRYWLNRYSWVVLKRIEA